MLFEYDPAKSAQNRAKHGIDFEDAQVLWAGRSVQKSLPHPTETRLLLTGPIAGRLWSAVFTMRGNRVRLISVRRARQIEEREYGQGQD
jgi:uncharacterized protein